MGTNSQASYQSYQVAPTSDTASDAAPEAAPPTKPPPSGAGPSPGQLHQLAVDAGLQYPALLGPAALANWLHSQDTETAKQIQDVALARFDALCAGELVGGKDLAQWQQLHPELQPTAPPVPVGFTPWQATPADIVAAQTAFAVSLTQLTVAKHDPTALAAVIAAENRLATAQSELLAEQLAAAVAAARHQTDLACAHLPKAIVLTAAEAGIDAGVVTAQQAATLSPRQLMVLLRASSPAADRDEMQQLAADRDAQLAAFAAASAVVAPHLGTGASPLPTLTDPGGSVDVAAFLAASGTQARAAGQITAWSSTTVHPSTAPTSGKIFSAATQAQTAIKTWTETQTLPALRAFAAGQGLGDLADHATRSQIALYLGTSVAAQATDATGAQAKAALNALTAKLAAKKATPPPKPVPPAPTAPKSSPRSFAAQHAQLVATLQHAVASTTAVPQRVDSTVVASWSFGQGQPASLGGAHPKTLHTGPDGSTWMFKPAQHSDALPHAEAAASAAYGRVGLPAIPVYVTTIDGTAGSVQPLAPGTSPLAANPKSWSQADVDAIVRLHVAAWAVGDHDLHPGNVLRTPGDGLVPVDAGQAFKHYGRDRLSVDYHPNKAHGTPRPVYQQAYHAALHSGLEPGITVNPAVAHPVIKQFESIPDGEWRAMLHRTAHRGAGSHHVDWVPAMRTRAAKTHGIAESAVTTTQIADAFLDHAVERKNTLRQAFAAFFTDELKMPAGAALAHLGAG